MPIIKKKLPGLLGFHLYLINCIPGKFYLFNSGDVPEKIIQLNPNIQSTRRRLKFALLIHVIIRLIQFVFILHSLKYDSSTFTGDKLIRMLFWLLIAYCYIIIITLAIKKCSNFVDVINALFQFQVVKSSRYVIFVFYISPIVAAIISILYGFVVTVMGIDPISLKVGFLLRKRLVLKYSFTITMSLFEIWNFATACIIVGLLLYAGMFFSYIALYEVANDLYKKSLKMYLETRFQHKELTSFISSYDQMQIHTILINNCF